MALPTGSKALYETQLQAMMDLIASKQAGTQSEDYDTQFLELLIKISAYQDILSWQTQLTNSLAVT